MKKQIILQQGKKVQTPSQLLDKLITLIDTKINVTDKLKQNVVKQIKTTLISLSEQNNSWHDLFLNDQQEEESKPSSQKKDQMIFESEFVRCFNLILEQAQPNDKKPQPDKNKKPQPDKNKKSQPDKNKDKTNDAKSKLQAAAKEESSSGGSGDEIFLVVSGPDDFEFQNADGQRFESKKSLQRLDGFLKKNPHILQNAIQKGEQQDSVNLSNAINEALEIFKSQILTLKAFANYQDAFNMNKLVTAAKACYGATWKFVSAQHKFGDRIKNKAQYQKYYFVLTISIIAYLASHTFEKKRVIYQLPQRQIAASWISKFRTQKKDIFDKNFIEKQKKQTLSKTATKYKEKVNKVYDLILKNCDMKQEVLSFIKDMPIYDIVKDAWGFNFKGSVLRDINKNQLASINKDLIINSDAAINEAYNFFTNSKKGYKTVVDPRYYKKIFNTMIEYLKNNEQVQYDIKAGDTLENIAKAHNVSVQQLQNLNGIKDANKIYAGQKLIIKADRKKQSLQLCLAQKAKVDDICKRLILNTKQLD